MLTIQTSTAEQRTHQTPKTNPQIALPGVSLPTPFWLVSPTTQLQFPCYKETAFNAHVTKPYTASMPSALTTQQGCTNQLHPALLPSTANSPELLPDIFAQEQRKSEETSPISVGGKIELDENATDFEITGGQVTIDIKTQ